MGKYPILKLLSVATMLMSGIGLSACGTTSPLIPATDDCAKTQNQFELNNLQPLAGRRNVFWFQPIRQIYRPFPVPSWVTNGNEQEGHAFVIEQCDRLIPDVIAIQKFNEFL